MKKEEWNEALDHIDPELVEEYVEKKEHLSRRKIPAGAWLRFGAVAACACLLVGIVAIAPLFRKEPPVGPIVSDTIEAFETEISKLPETESDHIGPEETSEIETSPPDDPVIRLQSPTAGPVYYGQEGAVGNSGMSASIANGRISVTARLKETLTDTYTFFGDWIQNEYLLLRMETIKVLGGNEMPEEFYFLMPALFMTDFTPYHLFVLQDMVQFGYEYSVLYNQTKGCAEQFDMVIMGCYKTSEIDKQVMAFDRDGYLDTDLWFSTSKWEQWIRCDLKMLDPAYRNDYTIERFEAEVIENNERNNSYVHQLTDISTEAAELLADLRSFEHGIYADNYRDYVMALSPEVQLRLRRYINGFPTNEYIFMNDGDDYSQTRITRSKAKFTKEDETRMPDLATAMKKVSEAYDAGELAPPHIQGYENLELSSYGIFGWYAQTENGIIGIVRVTFDYWIGYVNDVYRGNVYDDLYYVIEEGLDTCVQVARDDLLARIGEYETQYIFTGDYDEYGKIMS
ncbi:MAG: hypothetical protein E7610_05390 [Ruminococcaceae bacterium]|nr:hypothetical protein [Oscillospiraceae bacterium]